MSKAVMISAPTKNEKAVTSDERLQGTDLRAEKLSAHSKQLHRLSTFQHKVLQSQN